MIPALDTDADLRRASAKNAKIRGVFYAICLATALVGQATGVEQRTAVAWYVALAPLAALELGGVVFMANADIRRRLGESALLSRVVSGAFAVSAVAFNALAHKDPLWAGFFAGMSLAGYVTYLIDVGNKRRDRLRAEGKLDATAPVYGLWQWLRHPGLTRRARLLALANAAVRAAEVERARQRGLLPVPTTAVLGRLASLDAAREQVRRERREAALASAVRDLVAESADDRMATIAVNTYDMGQIAKRLAGQADYDGITALLARELTAEKLSGAHRAGEGKDATQALRIPVAHLGKTVAQDPDMDAAHPDEAPPAQPPRAAQPAISTAPARRGRVVFARPVSAPPASAEEREAAIARALAAHRDDKLSIRAAARQEGVAESTLRTRLAAAPADLTHAHNGHDHSQN